MSLPFAIRRERLKRQLIQTAIKGSPRDLAQYIVMTQDCDISISTTFLPFLSSALIPSSPISPQGYKNAVAAKDALLIIFTQCTTVLPRGSSKNAVIALLTAEYPRMLRWFCTFIDNWTTTFTDQDHGPFLCTIAHCMRTLMDSDDGLTNAVMTTPLAIEVSLKLWTRKIDNGGYITGDTNDSCIVVYVLERIVEDDFGRDSLLAFLHTARRTSKKVVSTIVSRIHELSTDRIDASLRIFRLEDLVRLADTFLDFRDQLPHYLLTPLQSSTFIFDLCLTLDNILPDRGTAFPGSVLQLIAFISDMALGDHGGPLKPIKKVKAALSGGFYRIITKTIWHLERSETVWDPEIPDNGRPENGRATLFSLLTLLRKFATYAIYPGPLRCLVKATSHLPLDSVLQEGYSGTFEAYWDSILRLVRDRQAMAKGVAEAKPANDMCHCIQHSDNRERGTRQKKCPQCHRVAYCSRHCQRLDWESGHREECALLVSTRSRIDQNLTPRVQASLATFVASFLSYNNCFHETEAIYGREDLSHTLVTVIDARFLPFKVTLISVEDLKEKILGHHFVENRFSQESSAHLEQNPNIHLAHAFFPWGGYAISMLVRLKWLGGCDVHVLSASVMALIPSEDIFLAGKDVIEIP